MEVTTLDSLIFLKRTSRLSNLNIFNSKEANLKFIEHRV